MKLYGSLTSPYVRKVRVVLAEKRIGHDFVVENPWDAGSGVPALNPLGKVPVLERDDGKLLYDSALIVDYLDSLSAPALIPAAGEPRWEVLRWHTLAAGVVDAVVSRLLETRRPPAEQSAKHVARQESAIARALEAAEKDLRAPHLVGARLTLADIALGVMLEYIDFRYAHDWRSAHPRLAQWLAPMRARPSFQATLPPDMKKPA